MARTARRIVAAAAATFAVPTIAEAHVKWFAPYIVGAAPRPVSATLHDVWFWTAIVLVTLFFTATRVVERTRVGEAVLAGFDRVFDPLWSRADDFMRVTTGAFFVAIFPGNIAQYVEGTGAFGLDTDQKRFARLFFQPVLVLWALWGGGLLNRARRAP